MKIIQKTAILLLMLNTGWLYAQVDISVTNPSAEQQQRLDLMKSKGVDASLTILPVHLMNGHWEMVSEIIGTLLEQKGLRHVEVGSGIFIYEDKARVQTIADSLKGFLLKNPVTTDYVLYAEMNGDDNPPPIDEIFCLVVDRNGDFVWRDILDSHNKEFTDVDDPDPMGYSILIAERLSPNLGLNAETARNAKPGKMAARMRERSGLPSEEEINAMPAREKIMRTVLKESQLVVFPIRVFYQPDIYAAGDLVTAINNAGLSKAAVSKNAFTMKQQTEGPNEMTLLWNMAKQFRDYLKTNPQEGDYFLFGDYIFTPGNWQAGYVHFVICDSKGDWVITDLQNSQQEVYIDVKPVSVEDCNRILYNRLESYL